MYCIYSININKLECKQICLTNYKYNYISININKLECKPFGSSTGVSIFAVLI